MSCHMQFSFIPWDMLNSWTSKKTGDLESLLPCHKMCKMWAATTKCATTWVHIKLDILFLLLVYGMICLVCILHAHFIIKWEIIYVSNLLPSLKPDLVGSNPIVTSCSHCRLRWAVVRHDGGCLFFDGLITINKQEFLVKLFN